MAIRKSELYSSLWAGCDELRGSMDASQYKDYVLVLLFMKYVSDKGGALVDIPEGASFYDMVKLKGQPDIGDRINKIIGELANENDLAGVITVADFNDDEKLGKGKDKVDRLSNLIEIFEKPELDFSSNKAEGDDILGDAYEFLMRHFATESGKSKGQFYTPAEVSRVMAKVIGIDKSKSQSETLYDLTCGSGSLLLKAANEAPHGITIYGQENDNATRALAVMNMWLHGNPASEIVQGNTLASPQFLDDTTGLLKTFNYIVSNPPFSFKSWMNGFDPANDVYGRFEGYAQPPAKNGDFAFLLHLIKSLKSDGKACIVLPLGVLFRGNTEADIRKELIKRGYIKGIIGLPANLFYGTGIAASLIVIDKENAAERKDVFMVDASKGFLKDGNKNRLREQDIHKIVDTFSSRIEVPKYSRIIPVDEIAGSKNDYNLNIPRYIDSQEEEDLQDIGAHLRGGIPKRDVDNLKTFWEIYPSLKESLFQNNGDGNYYELKVGKDEIKDTIFKHPEFIEFSEELSKVFNNWKSINADYMKKLDKGLKPKVEIHTFSEDLLNEYEKRKLIDKYDVYQHLMDFWAETMQDDMYELAADGWSAGNEVKRIEKKVKKDSKGPKKYVDGIGGLEGRLIPPSLIISQYLNDEQKKVDDLQVELESLGSRMDEMQEEHGGEEGLLANAIDDNGKISKGTLQKAIKETGGSLGNRDEYQKLKEYKNLMEEEPGIKKKIKVAQEDLERKIIAKYPALSIEEIKTIVVDKKWMSSIEERIRTELDNISHRLTGRIKELAERYEKPLPELTEEVELLSGKVKEHLKEMGMEW